MALYALNARVCTALRLARTLAWRTLCCCTKGPNAAICLTRPASLGPSVTPLLHTAGPHPVPVTLPATPVLLPGHVALVGAGPGAADLLTLRAWSLLQQCEVVIHDRLVGADILACIASKAEKIFVGKVAGHHAVPQREIERLMIVHAQAGKRVVRLKGGDPFIFGRGGEELQALRNARIACEVVPGISAAQGCASAAQIPLTHRDLARQCTLLPGYLASDTDELDWPCLAQLDSTLVFYMGVQKLEHIVGALLTHGMAPDMPAAMVMHGTLPDQHTEIHTLSQWQTWQERQNLMEQGRTGRAGLFIIGRCVHLARPLA